LIHVACLLQQPGQREEASCFLLLFLCLFNNQDEKAIAERASEWEAKSVRDHSVIQLRKSEMDLLQNSNEAEAYGKVIERKKSE
jgi:hypothetical protein